MLQNGIKFLLFVVVIYLCAVINELHEQNNKYIIIFNKNKELILFEKYVKRTNIDTIKNYYYTGDSIVCAKIKDKLKTKENDK